MAKALGFTTTGIVSCLALEYIESISTAVDQICFVQDSRWGGKLPETGRLSPTSRAMVDCSDVLIGIGGNEISRDELLAGKAAGKPVHFFPAEVNHAYWINRAKKRGQPPPATFWGAAHEAFVGEEQ